MTAIPAWLPKIVSVSGNWNKILAQLYQIFDRDFRQTHCCFEGQNVCWDQRRVDSPYEEGFWHLITKFDHAQNERLLDPRRAERLPWCRATITNSDKPEIKAWRYRESNNRIRVYLWIEEHDYVVILQERTLYGGENVAFLITAFYVEGNMTRKKLQKKYAKRIQCAKSNHRPCGR